MVLIRDALERDAEAITSITNAFVATTTYEWTDRPHTVVETRSQLRSQSTSGRPVLVAVEQGKVVGWATFGDFRDTERWPGYRPTVEHTIHVREQCWGRGVGRRLIDALADRARVAGKHAMVAAIDAENTGSVEFHRRLGFVEVGRMPEIGEKLGRRLDLILMQVILDDDER